MKPLDTVNIDFEDNEDVANMFADATAGGTLSLTLQVTVNEINEDHVSASIDGVENVSGADEGEEEEVEIEEEAEADMEIA